MGIALTPHTKLYGHRKGILMAMRTVLHSIVYRAIQRLLRSESFLFREERESIPRCRKLPDLNLGSRRDDSHVDAKIGDGTVEGRWKQKGCKIWPLLL